MNQVDCSIDVHGPGCHGKYAQPEAIGSVLSYVTPTVRDTLRMCVLRSSRKTGRPFRALAAASKVEYSGQSAGPSDSTRLHFRAPRLIEAAPKIFAQQCFWDDGLNENDTVFDLVADLLTDVSKQTAESDRFDSDLLRRIARYDSSFKRGIESVQFPNRRLSDSLPPPIDRTLTAAARSLISNTPSPKRVRVAGTLDMIRVSDRVFELVLADQSRLRALWIMPAVLDLKEYLNKFVVIDGVAVFRPSGNLLRVDTGAIESAYDTDAIFSKQPKSTLRDHIEKIAMPQRSSTGANAIYGKWPGDESEAAILAALGEMG